MGKHEAARDAQALYNSGAADDDDDLRDEIVRRMGLPAGTHLPPHTQGQIKTDENGNFILVNPRSGAITTPAVPTEGTPKPVGSFAKTQLGAANTRAANAQAGANYRAGLRGTGRGPAPDRATARKAAELVGRIETARKAMEQADIALGANPKDTAAKQTRANAQQAGEGWAAQLNALDAGYEAGAGEKGFPYYKQRGGGASAAPQGGRTIDGAVKAFTKRFDRAPTADEVARMKAALEQ